MVRRDLGGERSLPARRTAQTICAQPLRATGPPGAGWLVAGGISAGWLAAPPIAWAKLDGGALGVGLALKGGALGFVSATGRQAMECTPCGGKGQVKYKFIGDLQP